MGDLKAQDGQKWARQRVVAKIWELMSKAKRIEPIRRSNRVRYWSLPKCRVDLDATCESCLESGLDVPENDIKVFSLAWRGADTISERKEIARKGMLP